MQLFVTLDEFTWSCLMLSLILPLYIAYALLCNGSFFRYKFDDERVTKEDVKRALEEQYGGEEEVICLLFDIYPLKLSIVVVLMFIYATVATDKSWLQ